VRWCHCTAISRNKKEVITVSDQDHNPADDPYGQDEFLGSEGQPKPKREESAFGFQKTPITTITESYRTKAVWTLVAYVLIWIVGFIMNLVYLKQASDARKMGYQVEGMGCLWALLGVFGLGLFGAVVAIVVLASLGDSVSNVFQNIADSLATP
jgi:hypothetical protein